jgi:hypothetical protein
MRLDAIVIGSETGGHGTYKGNKMRRLGRAGPLEAGEVDSMMP